MSGGKGGGQSTKTEIPVWAEEATKRNLARAEDVQRIGYMPYYGPDVAAFNPTQQLAMQNNMDAAAAFGLASSGQNAMAGMPRATNYNGIQGYSSGGLYEQAVAEFERNKPGYAREYNDLFAKNSSSNVPRYPTPPYPNFPIMDDPNIPAGAGQQFPGPKIPIINVMDNYNGSMTSMPKMPDVDLSIVPPNSDLSMTSPFQIPLPSMPQMPQLPQLPAQLPQLPAQLPQLPAQLPQLPAQLPQLPAQLPQLPAQLPQLPAQLPQLPAQLPQLPAQLPQLPAQLPQLPAQLPQLPAQLPQLPAQMPQMPYQTQPAEGLLGSGIGTSVNAGPIPTGRGVADGVQMPSQDYMRMLRDFQTQGGSVGENATKKLAEAQAIIDANQSQPQMPQLPQIPQMVFERNMMPGQVGMAGPQQPLMQDVKDAGYPVRTALPIPAAMPKQNIDEMMKGLRNTRSNF
jgi:hypothetical protein